MSSDNRSARPPAAAGTFSAADLKRRMTEREAARAAEEVRRMKEQEEHQKAVMGSSTDRPSAAPSS
jgi:hypothetical protein